MGHELFKGKRKGKFNRNHKAVDRRSDFNRTTGREARARLKTLEDLDQRSRALKHVRRFVTAMETDLGGDITTAQRELVHRAAMISVLLGDMEARWLREEEDLNVGSYAALINTQNRVIHALGLKRVARDMTPTIDQYARTKRIAHDAEDAEEVDE